MLGSSGCHRVGEGAPGTRDGGQGPVSPVCSGQPATEPSGPESNAAAFKTAMGACGGLSAKALRPVLAVAWRWAEDWTQCSLEGYSGRLPSEV